MNLHDATVLVTGANRGLGREFARQALAGGARRVYATARRPDSIDLPGVERLTLDITDPAAVAAAATSAPDVDLVVNNAGISLRQDLITGDLDGIRDEFDVHFYGTLAVTRAFAPILADNGGGAIVNVMSALSFRVVVGATAYSAAKAAEWMLTNATRLELAGQGTQVLGAHLAATDTDMMAGYDQPMNDPADVVRSIYGALAAGSAEVLVDDDTRAAKRLLALDPAEAYAAELAG